MKPGFLIGMGFYAAVDLMDQALMGKERYLKAVDLLWTNDSWWPWAVAALVALFLGVDWRWRRR